MKSGILTKNKIIIVATAALLIGGASGYIFGFSSDGGVTDVEIAQPDSVVEEAEVGNHVDSSTDAFSGTVVDQDN